MATIRSIDSFGTRTVLEGADGTFAYFRLASLAEQGVADVSRLPFSIKVLIEAVVRSENGREVTEEDVIRIAGYDPAAPVKAEFPFLPARVLMQDFTGVPAVVDLAALRSAVARLGHDAERINPLLRVDLVIDHSVQVDVFNTPDAPERNAAIEFDRNRERYEFLRWGQSAFQNLNVVPPSSGICHQVNLEHLGRVVWTRESDGEVVAFPDTLVGTDSHTTMINGLGILGWGVGGIEAEAVMLGQPIYMLTPEVVGVKLTGALPPGTTATDLTLTITQLLREKGVVGKFVEFFGSGLSSISLPDRATIANMAPEYGATAGFFPVDDETLNYLRYTGRPAERIDLVERYCKAQGLFRADDTEEPRFADTLELDLSSVETCLSGPKRPQDRIPLKAMKAAWTEGLRAPQNERGYALGEDALGSRSSLELPDGTRCELTHGDVVIAAITSCTNTSNPSVLIGAGLLAKKAVEAGLKTHPYVKTSLAPGSKAVTEYLKEAGLAPYLDQLGFYTVGYGCTTCIGNSGPLPDSIRKAIADGSLVAASVLSGNRNFEGRINPDTKANYLASPPLVVAYALAGTVDIDLATEPIGTGTDGKAVYLKELWPTHEEIGEALAVALNPEIYRRSYDGIGSSNETWNAIPVAGGVLYDWKEESTYIQEPPFFTDMSETPSPIAPIERARVLVKVADSVTTDHISPAGAIPPDSPAGQYLIERGTEQADFNSYGSRRGNDRVMTRGTFANIRLRTELGQGNEGGWTTHLPTGELTSIHEASLRYKEAGTPVIVLAGKDYGMGSSRDWAAKGTFLLGVRAVLAESFERIHRSNLVGMGVLPLQFEAGTSAATLGLSGEETFSIQVDDHLEPLQAVAVEAIDPSGARKTFEVTCRIDTPVEIDYYRNGGVLHTVLRRLVSISGD